MSLCAYIEIQFAAPAPLLAALKRSVNVTILFVMWPPALQPILISLSGSAMPIAITCVGAGHHVKVRLLEVALDHVAQERIAIARAAAIVRPQHRVAFRGIHLILGRKAKPIRGGRAAVRRDDERILLARLVVDRVVEQSLDGHAVLALPRDRFNARVLELREVVVEHRA